MTDTKRISAPVIQTTNANMLTQTQTVRFTNVFFPIMVITKEKQEAFHETFFSSVSPNAKHSPETEFCRPHF